MAKTYKLNGSKLAYIAENYVTFKKMAAPKRLYVDMGENEIGEKAYGYLSRVYPVKTYDKGFTWADFTMVFNSEKDRNDAFEDMNGAISEWEEAQNAPEPEEEEEEDPPTEKPTVSEDEDEETKPAVDYSTYIVLGAAAIIIVLLLWDRK